MNAVGARRYQQQIKDLTEERKEYHRRALAAENKLVFAGRLLEIAIEIEASPKDKRASFVGAIVDAAKMHREQQKLSRVECPDCHRGVLVDLEGGAKACLICRYQEAPA